MPDRNALIDEKIQEPLADFRDAAETAAIVEFEGLRLDALVYYCERFLQGFVAEAMADALRGKQLQNLSPEVTQQVGFLLLTDFLAQLGQRAVTPRLAKARPQWHGQFVRRVAKLANVSNKPLVNLAARGPLDPDKIPALVTKLSEQSGMGFEKLLLLQTLMVENVIEDVLSPPKRKPAAGRKKATKKKPKRR
jgi:hypothetical protein